MFYLLLSWSTLEPSNIKETKPPLTSKPYVFKFILTRCICAFLKNFVWNSDIPDLSRDYFVGRTYLICSLGFNSVLLDNWRTIILRHTSLVYVQSQNAKSWKSTNYHVVFSQGWLSIINQRFPHSYPSRRKNIKKNNISAFLSSYINSYHPKSFSGRHPPW